MIARNDTGTGVRPQTLRLLLLSCARSQSLTSTDASVRKSTSVSVLKVESVPVSLAASDTLPSSVIAGNDTGHAETLSDSEAAAPCQLQRASC